MGKRIRLGLIFSFNEKWIGGSYYILNLISALSSLPDEDQPAITILSTNKADFLTAKKTGYKYLKYKNPFLLKRNLIEAFINRVGHYFKKKNIIDKRISYKDINFIFPATNEDAFSLIENKINIFIGNSFINYI